MEPRASSIRGGKLLPLTVSVLVFSVLLVGLYATALEGNSKLVDRHCSSQCVRYLRSARSCAHAFNEEAAATYFFGASSNV